MKSKVTQCHPSAQGYKAEILHLWASGVSGEDCTPLHSAQWKLSQELMWLDGHDLTDINEINYMEEKYLSKGGYVRLNREQ